MAADALVINRNKQHGNRVVRIADMLVELRTLVASTSAAADHMWDQGDYTKLEAQFGLEAGTGANFLSLLGLMQTIFNSTGEVAGANRKAQLDEFSARIAGQ